MNTKNIFLFSILFFFCACNQNVVTSSPQKEMTTTRIPVVGVEQIKKTTTPIPIHSSGLLGVREIVDLSFKMGGIIERIYIQETQRVKKGQLLATIRSTEIDAQVLRAQQALDKAERDWERIYKMYQDTVATLKQLENIKTVKKLAEADLNVAKFNQEYAKITAPVDGQILKILSDNNELVATGRPIIRLASNGNKGFVLRTAVADKDIVQIQLRDKATIHFDAHKGQLLNAFVSKIDEAADPQTGTFGVELSISSPTNLMLKSGFIGKTIIYPSRIAPYYKIDMNALIEGDEEIANIYLVEPKGNKKIVKKVELHSKYIESDFFITNSEQLEDGAQVVVQGASYLNDGAEVEIIEF